MEQRTLQFQQQNQQFQQQLLQGLQQGWFPRGGGGGGGGRFEGRGGFGGFGGFGGPIQGGGRAAAGGQLGGRAPARGGRGMGAGRGANVNDVLRPIGRLPVVAAKMPNTLVDLINAFLAHNLAAFEHATNKADWGPSLRNRYSMWLYLYKVIRLKATALRGPGEFPDKLRRAAGLLDHDRENRGQLTVPQYLALLKRETRIFTGESVLR